MSHDCHAIACKRSIPPEMLMCRGHWYKVPKGMQAEVWRTYRDGQCDDWNITKEYAAAAKAAITVGEWLTKTSPGGVR